MGRVNAASTVGSEHGLTGEKLSLLAVFAHPEDESFGPAGTLAKYANEGVEVTLVTATRPLTPSVHEIASSEVPKKAAETRDRLCSCRASGIRRACLFNDHPGRLSDIDPVVIQDRLVRLIREIQPQVIVTFGPEGLSGDSDYRIIGAAVAAAFQDAGDPSRFESHFREGLGAFAPQKLYHCVLPSSVIEQWGVESLVGVPDTEVTTILDVSSYEEAMKNALYCQRSHALDFIRWLTEDQRVQWDKEYYSLVESRLNKKPRREKDLFAGLR